MQTRHISQRGAVRSLSAVAGAGIGLVAGFVWLRLSPLECLVCAALGAFVFWTCSGPSHEGVNETPTSESDSDSVPRVVETIPLLPTLSWPATFPIQRAAPRPLSVSSPTVIAVTTRCAATRSQNGRRARRVTRDRLGQRCASV